MKKFAYMLLTCLPMATAAFHVAAVAVYLLPYSPLVEDAPKVLRTYTAAVLSQNWHFFAPTPGYFSDRLWIGCERDGAAVEWIDPVAEILNKAAWKPFGPHGKLAYVHRQVANSLLEEAIRLAKELCVKGDVVAGSNIPVCEAAMHQVQATSQYRNARRFAVDHCQMVDMRRDVSAVRFIAVRKYPFPYTQRHEYGSRPYHKVESLKFVANGTYP
jgi:hypothetical protein